MYVGSCMMLIYMYIYVCGVCVFSITGKNRCNHHSPKDYTQHVIFIYYLMQNTLAILILTASTIFAEQYNI